MSYFPFNIIEIFFDMTFIYLILSFQFGFSYKSLKSIGKNKSPSLNPVGVGEGMTESVREGLSLGGAKTGTILEVVMQLQGTVMTT